MSSLHYPNCRTSLPLLLVLLWTTGAFAQNANQIPKSKLSGKATILAINPQGLIQVKMEDGAKWIVAVPVKQEKNGNYYIDHLKIVVTGSAKPSWLRPGMFVKFSATFDEKGIGQQAINQMQVYIPSKEDPLGAYRAAGGNAGNLFDEEKAAGAKPKPQKATARFDIAGQLRGVRDGVLYVNAGGATLKVPVAEKCTISVAINGFQLCRIGDSVTLDAWYPTPQKALGRAQANRLDIEAAKPFEGKSGSKRPAPKDKDKPEEEPGEKKPGEEKPAEKKPAG
ncbi:MAG: hypothetical protein VB817_08700 [Pirellulaceae bacterium]